MNEEKMNCATCYNRYTHYEHDGDRWCSGDHCAVYDKKCSEIDLEECKKYEEK